MIFSKTYSAPINKSIESIYLQGFMFTVLLLWKKVNFVNEHKPFGSVYFGIFSQLYCTIEQLEVFTAENQMYPDEDLENGMESTYGTYFSHYQSRRHLI